MVDAFTTDSFTSYFFDSFACIMVDIASDKTEFWKQDHPPEFWNSVILGAFYVPDASIPLNSNTRSNQITQDAVPMSATPGFPFPNH
jgi:hypothetical protein